MKCAINSYQAWLPDKTQREDAVTKACFVILVHADRSPVLLGPMSETTRTQHMRDLRDRYGLSCGLHALDVNARSAARVTVKVKRYEQQGG